MMQRQIARPLATMVAICQLAEMFSGVGLFSTNGVKKDTPSRLSLQNLLERNV
jgi:hypothetical protein